MHPPLLDSRHGLNRQNETGSRHESREEKPFIPEHPKSENRDEVREDRHDHNSRDARFPRLIFLHTRIALFNQTHSALELFPLFVHTKILPHLPNLPYLPHLLRDSRDLYLRVSLTVSSKRLMVTLATLELANDDLIIQSVHDHFRFDLGSRDIRLSDDRRLSILGKKQHFVERDGLTVFGLKAWNVHFHAFLHLFLEAGNVDECKHELGECKGRKRQAQHLFLIPFCSLLQEPKLYALFFDGPGRCREEARHEAAAERSSEA